MRQYLTDAMPLVRHDSYECAYLLIKLPNLPLPQGFPAILYQAYWEGSVLASGKQHARLVQRGRWVLGQCVGV